MKYELQHGGRALVEPCPDIRLGSALKERRYLQATVYSKQDRNVAVRNLQTGMGVVKEVGHAVIYWKCE